MDTLNAFTGIVRRAVDDYGMIEAGDRITHNGTTFEVDGAPYTWESPTGRVTHLHANLVEWVG